MTKLTNSIAILSPAKRPATLIAIDTDTKTCTIDNGEEKTVRWTTAAAYKVADTGRALTPTLLAALLDDADTQPGEESAAADTAPVPTDEAQGVPESVHQEVAASNTSTQEVDAQPKAMRKRAPKGTITENEKIFLSMIPKNPEFKGTDSELGARAVIKQAQEARGMSLVTGRAVFASLKNKGYYTAKGRESGQVLTTLQLTELGIQYLKDNSLLVVDEAEGVSA